MITEMTNKRFFAIAVFLLALLFLLIGCVGSPEEQKLSELTKKAEAGDAEAQYKLAVMYYEGEGVSKDAAKAAEWFQKAAAQGNAEAQFSIARMFYHGEGMSKDITKSAEWYQKAAAQGHAVAQRGLGLLYYFGEGVPKDVAKAVEWLKKSAEQGDAGAQFVLGVMYADGEGVPKDFVKAAEWFQKAAAQGLADAQWSLGGMYYDGEGMPQDYFKAAEWYQKAAAQGHADAQCILGVMYYFGRGVPMDKAKAAKWYQKAAIQGQTEAQQRVGTMYWFGVGVLKDPVLAYAWLNLAAARGDESAKFWLVREVKLTPTQLAEAQRLSSNWEKGQILAREGRTADDGDSTIGSGLTKTHTGTAFFVTIYGHALTSYHIVAGCEEVHVEGIKSAAIPVEADPVNDIALIQIPNTTTFAAPFCSDPAKLRQGEDIVVFGYPLNAVLSSGGNLTPGVVSALAGLGNNTNQIQITAPIQPGSSGSPVLNKKGEVVGMVSMKLSDRTMAKATGTIGQNVNFAVSGQTLKTFFDAHKVNYRTGWLISFNKKNEDLADEARKWTLVVECWK